MLQAVSSLPGKHQSPAAGSHRPIGVWYLRCWNPMASQEAQCEHNIPGHAACPTQHHQHMSGWALNNLIISCWREVKLDRATVMACWTFLVSCHFTKMSYRCEERDWQKTENPHEGERKWVLRFHLAARWHWLPGLQEAFYLCALDVSQPDFLQAPVCSAIPGFVISMWVFALLASTLFSACAWCCCLQTCLVMLLPFSAAAACISSLMQWRNVSLCPFLMFDVQF